MTQAVYDYLFDAYRFMNTIYDVVL